MTTSVTVEAHCDERTKVRIEVEDCHAPNDLVFLENGERWTGYIYGGREVKVMEVPK